MSIKFITLTNTGYIDYTLNCLESLNRIKSPFIPHSYCVGEEAYNTLKNKGYDCTLINNDATIKNFQTFQNKNWHSITYQKFPIIYENLQKYDYVCFTDGDIVYENNTFMDYLVNNIEDNDLIIQSEGHHSGDVCTGFMFIKSNEKMLSLFNPDTIKNNVGWNDQLHINNFRHTIKYKELPLDLFPNGKHYFNNSNLTPYLIHFNWLVGHDKKNKMIFYKKWLI